MLGKLRDVTIFSEAEEKALIKGVMKCADWGFPLNINDLRMFVKYYLGQQKNNS